MHREWTTVGSAAKVTLLCASLLTITVAHFTLGHATHGWHVVHIVLAGTYLAPIIAGAVWFRVRGAALVAAIASCAYYVHIRLSWPNQPMENADQFGWIAVFCIIAGVTGVLIELQERERVRRLRAEQCAEREAVIEGIAGLSNALRARDEYTRQHSEHVSQLAVALGIRLGLAGERLDLIRLAGLVHDIGKIGVRDDVLLKPDELTPGERAAVERHPVLAAEILRPIRGAKEIADIVVAHHECPDGSGYPHRLKGEQIPVEAGIIRVADVFASFTEKRPYKPAIEAHEAIEIMERLAGAKLDATAFGALKRLVTDTFPAFTEIKAREGA